MVVPWSHQVFYIYILKCFRIKINCKSIIVPKNAFYGIPNKPAAFLCIVSSFALPPIGYFRPMAFLYHLRFTSLPEIPQNRNFVVIVRRVLIFVSKYSQRAPSKNTKKKEWRVQSQYETPHLKIFMPAVGFSDGMRDADDNSACRSNDPRKSKRAHMDRFFLCNGELDLQQPAGFL